jgi:amino acid adenylation domain-containing protein/non-ribosomal peptide synthase protein (TIGR01720 family)
MDLTKLLENLSAKNVELWLDGNKLHCRSPENSLTPELLRQIKQSEPEIIQILSQSTNHPVTTYPLCHGQKAPWFLYQLAPSSNAYNATYAAKLVTNLDIPALKQAAQALVERHPVLRTTFATIDGEPVQTVHENQKADFSIEEAFDLDQDDVNNWLSEKSDGPFDLEHGPILRFDLLINHINSDKLATKEHILLITLHQIVGDFRSLEIMIGEFQAFYKAITTGVAAQLSAQNYQYQDYIKWSEQMLASSQGESLWTYWQQQLSGELPLLNLPTHRPRPQTQTYNGASRFFTVEEELRQLLTELANREGASLYILLLTALQILLLRYTNQEDILIGSTMENRSRTEFENIVGNFTNPVVLRGDLSGKPTFQELLKRSRSCVLNALDHQDYPFSLLVEQLQPVRNPSFSPLYQVALVYDRSHQSIDIDGLILESLISGSKGAAFDLTLTILEEPGSLKGAWNYNTDLFDDSTIARMMGHFVTLLEAIVANPQQRIDQLPMLTAIEQQQLLVEWNDTQVDYPQDKCIHNLFEEQVKRTPDAVAVVFENQQLTYHELNCRANQLAHYLRSLGVGTDALVGICVERSLEMVVGLLGILKAGGAYVPLDPEYPQDRLSFMLEDARVSVLLSQQRLLDRLPEYQAKLICLDQIWEEILPNKQNNPIKVVTPTDLANVIYTSGSTGKPKGVMVEHSGLCNLAQAQIRLFGLDCDSRVLQFASFSFDACVSEILMALGSGARLYLGTKDSLMPGMPLIERLRDDGITHVTLPPSALAVLPVEDLPTLQTIIVAGEACAIELMRQWSKGRNFFNAYGPTEASVCATVAKCTPEDEKVTIGHPIANKKIYILDSDLQLVPVGVPGELHICGVGLARGYLNRPELTQEKFIPNPFGGSKGSGEQGSREGERLYKTGDLARYLPDGNIEYLGRIDNQVKIRGFRIELGEVEAALSQHPHVQASCVIAREDNKSDKRLVAYIVAQPEQAPTIKELVKELRSFLKEKLPEYMVPSAIVILESLPLSPNGKIDRRALPTPDPSSELSDKYVAPRTPIEEILAVIWQQLLKVELVGRHDNFFELGGHSLLATQFISRVRTKLKVEIPLRSLFAAPTIAQLAPSIQQLQQQDIKLSAPPILRRVENAEIPLSYAQQRLWFLDQLESNNTSYKLSIGLRLLGTLNVAALEQSFREIIHRHEALRTNFVTVDGKPLQIIQTVTNWTVTVVDLQHLSTPVLSELVPSEAEVAEVTEQKTAAQKLLEQQAIEPFDLAHDALIRATLLILSETEQWLLVCMHHIVCDPWSINLFFQELEALYNAYSQGQPSPLLPLSIQYADFAIWQRQWLVGEVLQNHLSYWEKQLANAPTFLPLPTDRPRPAVQTFNGSYHMFTLSVELTQQLEKLSQQQGVTMFMTLLAVYNTLLYRYTGQEDILVGTPVANRDRTELEGLLGFFVNTLVMRTQVSGDRTFNELLPRIREMALSAYAHQDLPFKMLVEALQPERDLSHTPLFQVMFVLLNAPMSEIELTGLSVSGLPIGITTAKFDLTLSMENTPNGLFGWWEYNTDLFDSSTIERMTLHFLTLLEAIVGNPQERISQLPILTASEQQQLLVEWNDTGIDYPQDKCIHHLFEQQVELTPDAVAVVFENQQLTYHELNNRANQLAHYLQSLGVKPDVLVGICVERSLEMVVGLLAILKAGGAYVPLDPEYPSDRLTFMLDDTQVGVLLTQERLLDKPPATPAKVVFLDEICSHISQNNQDNPVSEVTASHLANVIYTSGSTGKPKGVMVEHSGLCNLAQAQIQTFGVHCDSRVLQFASFSFDACISEILMALGSGARLYLGTKDALMPGMSLIDRFRDDGITHITLAPSALAVLPKEKLSTLQTIIVAGEACSLELMRQWSKDRNFFNAYGPTEASVCATIAKCTPEDDKVTIGRPISNTQIYILDQNQKPVPVGVAGELHIGGGGLARGYLNQPELTQEKFILNPFSGSKGEERLYKTGDLARYLPDGNIEYLGRIDNQVKIRGFRIELGEIEAALSQHEDVQVCCVIAREDIPGDKRLVAYIVPQPEITPTFSILRSFLKEKLPDHMIPSAIAILESLPLSPNGKIDRRALPAPEARTGIENDIVQPRTPIEEKLAEIWAQVLTVEQIGIHDNFFELGGDSILSIQIISRAKIADIKLTVKQLFANPTIAQLATVAATTKARSIEQGLVSGTLPLTPIQHWFFQQELPEKHHFNQSFILTVPSDLNIERLEQVWQQLLVHHDGLRLRFTQKDTIWQQNHAVPTDNITIKRFDLSKVPETEIETVIETRANELQASLNLSENLVQVAFFWLGIDKKARLLIVIHHLVVDGVSWRILLEDLQTAYQQLSQGQTVQLPAKTTSFKDWAQQLTEYAQSEVLKSELAYWLSASDDAVDSIPVDYPEGVNTTASALTVTVSLNEAETLALLQDVPKAYKTQINDVLLTALVLVLSRWTDRESVLFNLEGHGREEIIDGVDLSRTVGWFTTIFPVVVSLGIKDDFGTALKSVKEQLRAIPQKGIGYGLLRYLSPDTEITDQLQALPQAEISFNYLGQFDQLLNQSSLLQSASESAGHIHGLQNNRAHLLDINSMITGERLQIEWTYSKNFHQDTTIESLAQEFVQTLQKLIAHCLSPENGGYTPSDFPLVKLNQQGLEQLLASSTSNWQNIADIYPLSGVQQGMLFESLYAPDSGVYFQHWICTLNGALNLPAFEQAWQQVVARHSILRTAFVWEELTQPLQVVYRQVDVQLQTHDWQQLSAQQQQQQLEQLLQSQRQQGFQLSVAPLMHLCLIQLSADSYQFIFNHHHLLLDGWSMPLLLQDLLQFYQANSQGETLSLQPTPSYRNYIAWLQQQDLTQAELFWQQKLLGFNAPTPLVVGKLPSVEQQPSGYSTQQIQLTATATAQLQTFARQHQVTMNNLVQATWSTLLCRYSQETDVVFGATVSARPPAILGIESMVGIFINTLPVRVQVSEDTQVLALLKDLQAQQVESEQYSYSSLAEIQGLSDVPRGTSLFESIVVFENYPIDEALQQKNYSFSLDNIYAIEQTNYPLTVVAVPGEQLFVKISYDNSRFDDTAIARLLGHFQTLLEGIVANPSQQIFQLPMLTQPEEHQLLVEWNDTQVDYPQDKCIHQLFEEQVERTPDAIAVVFGDVETRNFASLTYRELNCRANQLANYLQTLGVKPDVLVGICVERSLEMVVGLLGILKAGGAYVPLDRAYPQERLSYMLMDSGVEVLLTQQQLVEGLPKHEAVVVCLDSDWTHISKHCEKNLITDTIPNNLVYTIYTSGSTGKPKGAGVYHRGFLNLVNWMVTDFQFTSKDSTVLISSLSFDLTQKNIFAPLIVGGILNLPPDGFDPDYILDLVWKQRVTWVNCTPSTFASILTSGNDSFAKLQSLRYVFLGGEPISMPSLLSWQNSPYCSAKIVNSYGPTECADVCCAYTVQQPNEFLNQLIPIGKPLPNVHLHIMDQNLQLVPVGVVGELCITGIGVGKGYINDLQRTNEKFIPNPFAITRGGERLYKTGDLARYLPDGNIEYLGRIDNQVKIRGFRIELGEIEAALSKHSDVQTLCVIVREDNPGDKRLVAYIVPQPEITPKISQLRSFLKEKLPDHMVPSAFVILEALPLTPNGKIDRRALPQPVSRIGIETEIVRSRTPIEAKLAEIWAQVLRIEEIGIDDNYFELGGDSILSIQIISRAKVVGIKLTVKQLFANPTIAQLATVATTTKALSIGQGLVSGTLPLTPIQHWFFQQNLKELHHFNQSFLLTVPSDLNLEILQQVWQQLLVHHDAFRLRFTETDTTWQQHYAPPTDNITIPRFDLSKIPQTQIKTVIQTTANEIQASLNLNENLVQVAFFGLGIDKGARLLIVIHHLVVDGVSWRILLEDLQTAYGQLSQGKTIQLPAKTTSFQDWAQQLTEYAQSQILKSELDYWLSASYDSVDSIPVDYLEGVNITASAKTLTVSLDEAETQALLQDVPKAYKTQINDILLTALALALSSWTDSESVLFNLEGHGREEIIDGVDLSRTVGWFTTIFPVVIDLENTDDLGRILKSVKEQLRAIPNKGIGYGLLRYLTQDAEISAQLQALPQAEISFNYLGQFDQVVNTSSLMQLANEPSGNTDSLQGQRFYLLEVNAMISNEQLQIEWTYSSNIHQHETIENIAQEFVETLQQLIAHCLSPENTGFTPTDFPLIDFNQLELDQILQNL